jgi:hypothetical protein
MTKMPRDCTPTAVVQQQHAKFSLKNSKIKGSINYSKKRIGQCKCYNVIPQGKKLQCSVRA